jgi:DNA-binding beta-propeller fold protein YncE
MEKKVVKRNLSLVLILVSISLWSAVGFVVNSGSETLSRIDFETGEVNNVFSVLGSMPNRVELTQEYAYVVNSGDNNVQKIDLLTGETDELIFIGLSTNPYDIIIDNDFAFVSGGLSNKIYKIDLDTDEIIGSLNVGGNPAGMTVLNDKLFVGNTDYSNSYANCSVSIIDLNSFTVIATIPTEVNPQFLAVINGNIHISCGGDWGNIPGKICILDPLSEEITDIIEIGGVTHNMAVSPNDVVYVSDGFGYSLFAYDAENFSMIYNSSNPFSPGGTMVAADEENLFVLGGEWGQNFSVKKFDFNENLIAEYTVALYATDIKLMPEQTGVTNYELPITNFKLSNYPNPFNPTTTISFSTEQNEQNEILEVEIYNLKGQKIRQFSIFNLQSSIVWDGTDQTSKPVSSGVYFYQLNINGKTVESNKMLLMK